ncbi:helix-turn-helix domain-containing protein [Leeia oryzae]|uniref:helix-turn-helix domain-containing protein n=1 Tax=Leeia oryzae TaxID=356662 RepID=UPI0003A49C50|nr:helix-turn-helix transcriptional regulator [Leeia oryzae]
MNRFQSSYVETATRCMRALGQVLPVSASVFYRIDANLQPSDYILQHMRQDMHQTYLGQYQQLDPLHPARCYRGQGVVPIAESQPGMLAVNHYRQRFLSPYQMADVVEVFVGSQGQPRFGLSLLRDMTLGMFGQDELQLLNRLQGFLEMSTETISGMHSSTGAASLTEREQHIAGLVCQGASNKDIARRLGIGLPTVKTHLAHVFEKLDVKNRTELAHVLLLH